MFELYGSRNCSVTRSWTSGGVCKDGLPYKTLLLVTVGTITSSGDRVTSGPGCFLSYL